MMDQNRPARALDTAYNALKANPAATNQIMQAAAQGAPVGLKGLAAAAAQQSQQQAQQAMSALQQRGPQPNVIQQLAHAGIMSQMDTGLPGAPVQEEIPQMMAGGGLVAFADGGNVLPPDVIEAIQSHFAEGGDVRGFAGGGGSYAELYDSYLKRLPSFSSLSKEEAQAEGKALTEMLKKKYAAENIVEGLTKSSGSVRPGYEELYKLPEGGAETAGKIGRSYSSVYPKADLGAAEYSPYRAPEAPMSMTEKLATAAEPYESTIRSPASSAMEKLAQSAEYSPEAIKKSAWTGSEGFRGFKMPRIPEPAKKLWSLVEKNPELMLLLDPRTQATADIHSGIGKMVGERLKETEAGKSIDEGVNTFLERLRPNWIPEGALRTDMSSGAEDVLSGLASLRHTSGYAYGGDVRGFAAGDILKALAGPTESPGMAIVNKLKGLFSADESPKKEVSTTTPREESNVDNILSTLGVTEFSPTGGMYKPEILDGQSEGKPKGQYATWKPEDHDGHPVTPRVMVPEEGRNVYKVFDEAKKDVPSAAATPGVAGLGAGVDMEKMRDLIIGLGGHKELSPELSKKLSDLEDSARTSTILQSALGALGAGLSSPYGGRFALGKAALGALSGYQHGIGSEEDIGRKAFDVLRGYSDAPAEEKTKARDLLFGQLGKAAELQSEERRALLRGGFEDKLAMEAYKERNRLLHPEVHGGALAPRGSLTQGDLANLRAKAIEQARKDAADALNSPPFRHMTDAEQAALADQYYSQYLASANQQTSGLGGNINAAQAGGLGGGAPRIYTKD